MGLLDIYYNVGTELNQINNDYVTQYPSTNTGTPTNTQIQEDQFKILIKNILISFHI